MSRPPTSDGHGPTIPLTGSGGPPERRGQGARGGRDAHHRCPLLQPPAGGADPRLHHPGPGGLGASGHLRQRPPCPRPRPARRGRVGGRRPADLPGRHQDRGLGPHRPAPGHRRGHRRVQDQPGRRRRPGLRRPHRGDLHGGRDLQPHPAQPAAGAAGAGPRRPHRGPGGRARGPLRLGHRRSATCSGRVATQPTPRRHYRLPPLERWQERLRDRPRPGACCRRRKPAGLIAVAASGGRSSLWSPC